MGTECPGAGNELFPSAAWRLLLPTPDPESVTVVGSGPAATAATAMVAADRSGGRTGAALAVADDFAPETIEQLFDALPAGGTAYLQGSWPRRRSVARLIDELSRAGFGRIRIYSLSPSDDRWEPSWWIPVGEPAVVRYLAGLRAPVTSSVRPRALAMRAALASLQWLAAVAARRPWILHPRRNQQLCAVAAKPPAAAAAAEPAVTACVGDGRGRALQRPAVAMRVGGSSTDQPIVLLFERDRSEPSIVVKVPDLPEELVTGRHEARTLRALTEGPSPVSAVPRPIEVPPLPGLVALAQSAVPGRPMTRHASPGRFEELANAVTDWLIELALATKRPVESQWYRELVESSIRVLDGSTSNGPPLLAGLDRIGRAVRGYDPGLVVCCHRDLGPWNIHLDDAGGLGIIDWAGAVSDGPPGTDLVHFLTHLALVSRDGYRPDRQPLIVADLIDPGSATGVVADRCLDRYGRELAIDIPSKHSLRVMTWMLAARRQTPDERPGSIYTGLLAAELDQQGEV